MNEPVQAVHLVRDSDPLSLPADQSHAPFWAWSIATVVLAVAIALVVRTVQTRWREEPSARAARRLAEQLRLTREEKALLAQLALAGVKPCALLLSHKAFEKAATAAHHAGRPGATIEAITSLHRKVFGSPA